jgi:ABC-type phosphate/phosphonate transport system substrate-binding protein
VAFATYLAPNMMSIYELVTEEVGRRIGLETELVIKTSYDSLERDESEVCFVCSLPYVTLERQGLAVATPVAAPVLIGDRYGGRPVYFSDVIVHRDAPIRSFLDLRGHSWAFNEALSHSGCDVLVTMADDAAAREQLAVGLVERFVPVDEGSYDDIRVMVDACERAGFVELR